MWTDLQAFLVWALGDLLMFSMMVYTTMSFFLALATAAAWSIRNLRP